MLEPVLVDVVVVAVAIAVAAAAAVVVVAVVVAVVVVAVVVVVVVVAAALMPCNVTTIVSTVNYLPLPNGTILIINVGSTDTDASSSINNSSTAYPIEPTTRTNLKRQQSHLSLQQQ